MTFDGLLYAGVDYTPTNTGNTPATDITVRMKYDMAEGWRFVTGKTPEQDVIVEYANGRSITSNFRDNYVEYKLNAIGQKGAFGPVHQERFISGNADALAAFWSRVQRHWQDGVASPLSITGTITYRDVFNDAHSVKWTWNYFERDLKFGSISSRFTYDPTRILELR